MLPHRYVVSLAVGSLVILGAGVVSGQTFPNKPIRIVSTEAGGASDFAARLIAQGLSAKLGQSVIVDNRGGANGTIAVQAVVNATPDGYTVLLQSRILWIGPLLEKMPYDPVKDLAPIALVAEQPNVLVVQPSLPVKSVSELIALAKIKPGALNYASTGTGGSAHLAAELFKSMASVNILRVAYRGTAQALNALLSSEVHLAFPTAASVLPQIKLGKVIKDAGIKAE